MRDHGNPIGLEAALVRALVTLASGLSLILPPCAVGAVFGESTAEILGEVAAGYDSNPAQSSSGAALAFGRYAFEGTRAESLAVGELRLGIDGWYRDYSADNDSYRLALRGAWARPLHDGAGELGIAVSGAIYRDALVPADERNEIALELRYDRLLSARDNLGLLAEARRLAYRNASLPWAGRPGSESGSESGSGSGDDGHEDALETGSAGSARHNDASEMEQGGSAAEPRRRDDNFYGLGVELTHHWSPRLSTMVSATHARCVSPVTVQAYVRNGAGLLLQAEPAASWGLELGLGWSMTRYSGAPRQQEREDRQISVGIAARRSLTWGAGGPNELYCGVDWLNNRSTIVTRSFKQWVTQCGLAWSFR